MNRGLRTRQTMELIPYFRPLHRRAVRLMRSSILNNMTVTSPPRSRDESITEMTEYVLPQHANALGNVFGGQIMAWVDLCAAITAQRHSGRMAVTAFVDDLMFENPVKVGEVVQLRARVSATFRTSMEIEVTVTGEDSQTRKRWPCVHAYLTFVCIDSQGKPAPVPPLLLDCLEVQESQARGALRRAHRLSKQDGPLQPVASPESTAAEPID